MQATVHHQDPATGAGTVVTDDGVLLPFSAEVFAASGLRLVRSGQRLSLHAEGEGAERHVSRLWLAGVTA